jgi:hypothetical protein
MNNVTRTGLFSRLFGSIRNINFSSILSGTQKTLNVVNQTIPLVKQITPVIKNAKTMFKVMNEFKRVNTPSIKKVKENNNVIKEENVEFKKINNGPVFFQ